MLIHVGDKFGRLTVASPKLMHKGRSHRVCNCECGEERLARETHLKNGEVKSCGCLRRDRFRTNGPKFRALRSVKGTREFFMSKISENKRVASVRGYVGITNPADELVELYKLSQKHCEICGKPEENLSETLSIDHCHKTGEFRGFLCRDCNRGLGCFNDEPGFLRAAAEYLSR